MVNPCHTVPIAGIILFLQSKTNCSGCDIASALGISETQHIIYGRARRSPIPSCRVSLLRSKIVSCCNNVTIEIVFLQYAVECRFVQYTI